MVNTSNLSLLFPPRLSIEAVLIQNIDLLRAKGAGQF
jgi:hypothetical protein